MIKHYSTPLAAALMVAASPLAAQVIPDDTDIVALPTWSYDELYSNGQSADALFDRAVHGEDGDEIGDVEDIIIGSDGTVLSIVAEVGGFWDVGDTHVSIPIDEVDMSEPGRITVPVTEDNVDYYGFWDERGLTAEEAGTEVVEGIDDAQIPRAWRASELIGDYARLRQGEALVNYGYVNDLILQDGEVAAVIVQPRGAFGPGFRAYPYYGYGFGWYAGRPYYDLPYTEDEVSQAEEFDYDRIEN